MREFVSWLNSLQKEIEPSSKNNPASLTGVHRRVAYPRIEPLHGPGFLRFQGLEQFHRPGHGPEALSLIQIFRAQDDREPELGEQDALNRQIGAVLALSLGRSIEIPSEQSYQLAGSPRLAFLPLDAAHDRVLHAPLPAVDEVNAQFEEVASHFVAIADSDDLVAIGAAAEMHYGACTVYKTNLPSAYVLTVGALETLSARFEDAPHDWQRWDRAPSWDRVIEALDLTAAQASGIREELLRDRQIRLGERFTSYVMREFSTRDWLSDWREWTWSYDGTTGEPNGGSWSTVDMNQRIPSEDRSLRQAIKKSYGARSRFVHSGSNDLTINRDMQRQVEDSQGVQALPFTVLRAVLARSIRRELGAASNSDGLPSVVGTFDDGS